MALSLLARSCRSQVPLLKQAVKFSSFTVPARNSLLRNATVSNVFAQKVPKMEIMRKIATSQPLRSSGGGGHAMLWTIERGLALRMLFIIPTALAFPSQALDALMSVSIVMHVHWGLDAIVTDYVRPILVGNVVPKVAHGFAEVQFGLAF